MAQLTAAFNQCFEQRQIIEMHSENNIREKLICDWKKTKSILETLPKIKHAQKLESSHAGFGWKKVYLWMLGKHMNGIGLSVTIIRLKVIFCQGKH